jgi:hypothetical protein
MISSGNEKNGDKTAAIVDSRRIDEVNKTK